jgi:RNA polymerase sigma-70 factor (ECF subfamily)
LKTAGNHGLKTHATIVNGVFPTANRLFPIPASVTKTGRDNVKLTDRAPSRCGPNDALRDSLAEKKWLTALAKGDSNALGGIYEMYGERIFRYTYRMLGNRSDAEDATAETFLRVLRRSAELRADGAFRTWLFRIARNLCIDKMRQHKLMELPADAQYSGGEEKATLRITIQQALSDLPTEYREPLVLCDLEDMAAREAAEVLKISVPALKSRLYRGRRALRDKLGGTLERMS